MLIEVRSLKKTYTTKEINNVALRDVNLTIEKGDFISIIGRSGSGKSTLLNVIVGLLKPTMGQIYFNNHDIWQMKDNELSEWRNQQIGYVPQGYNILSNFSVIDNVRLPYFLKKRSGDGISRATELLDHMGIGSLAERYPETLSGGEVRRTAIARALMNNPTVLAADEPTGDLDEKTTGEIMKLFRRINKNGTTILMVTHEIDFANYGNRLLKMKDGALEEVEMDS